MAVEAREPSQPVIHPDHGTQFTSWALTSRVRVAGLFGSMGTISDGYDNAMIESLWGRMRVDFLDRKKWRTRWELASAIFEDIEGYYNRSSRHSALTWGSPRAFGA